MTMTSLLSTVGSVITQVLTWIPDVFDAIVASPIALVFICLALVGTVIAFAKKILL